VTDTGLRRGRLVAFGRRSIVAVGLATLAWGCGSSSTSPQTGFAGKWSGELLQPKTGGNTVFTYSLNLSVSGTSVSGTSHIAVSGQPQYYADFTVSGTATGPELDFTEIAITAQVPPNTGGSWCIKRGTLTLSGDGKTMRGTWSSTSGCAPGTLSLTRG
jgi:hypothetical protein